MALVDRVQAVMLKPQQAWPVIAMEPDTVPNILQSYVLPLVIFATVCQLVGGFFLIGLTGPIVAIGTAIIKLIASFVSIYVFALIVDALAPTFGSMKNPLQAMKVSAYAYTPAMVGSIFLVIPFAGALLTALVSLYCIYQTYLGLIAAMGTPKDKAIGYTAVAIIVAIIVSAIISIVLGLALIPFYPHALLHPTYTSP